MALLCFFLKIDIIVCRVCELSKDTRSRIRADCSSLNLTSIPLAINGINAIKLSELYLKNNKIANFQAQEDYLTQLEVLDLGENVIAQEIEHESPGLPLLRYFSLRKNRLKKIPSGIFKWLNGLQYLDLSGNLDIRYMSFFI